MEDGRVHDNSDGNGESAKPIEEVCKGRTHEEGPIVSIPDTLSHENKVAEEGDQDHCEPIRSTEK